MNERDLRLRDAYPYNDAMNAMEVETANRRFEQLIERRERLIERSRFGVLALNGASLIGVLSAFERLQAGFGLDSRSALAFFVVGMTLALISIFFETNFLAGRAAQMFSHLSELRTIRATLDDRLSENSEKRLGEQLQRLQQRAQRSSVTKIDLDSEVGEMPNDFAYSPAALTALNFSAGAWVGGVLTLLISVF